MVKNKAWLSALGHSPKHPELSSKQVCLNSLPFPLAQPFTAGESGPKDFSPVYGATERLKPPERVGKRVVVTANDLPRAGVYYMTSQTQGTESTGLMPSVADLVKTGTPIAVVPDLVESENLAAYTKEEINEKIGFEPIHIIAGAGEGAVSTGAERLNREWTVLVLLAVLLLVLCEVALAWWCGKAW